MFYGLCFSSLPPFILWRIEEPLRLCWVGSMFQQLKLWNYDSEHRAELLEYIVVWRWARSLLRHGSELCNWLSCRLKRSLILCRAHWSCERLQSLMIFFLSSRQAILCLFVAPSLYMTNKGHRQCAIHLLSLSSNGLPAFYILFPGCNLCLPLTQLPLSLIHIWRCRRDPQCRSRWSPDH